jgi:hypothetical protein|uniref:Uncharacterized protein n=1 Tax=Zea mays TaxID=4577 RepID=A0A804LKK6_MAIZE
MVKRKYLVVSIDASREKEQPVSEKSSPILLHSSTKLPSLLDDEFGLRLCILIEVLVVSFVLGQQVLYNVDTRLEKLLRALSEEGVLDLLLLLLNDVCGLIVVLCMEEMVDLAISLEPDLEGLEVVATPLEELQHRYRIPHTNAWGTRAGAEWVGRALELDHEGSEAVMVPMEELMHRARAA